MKKLISALVAGSWLVAGSQTAVAQQTYQNKQAKKVRPTYTYAGVKYSTQDLDELSDNNGDGIADDCTQDGIYINGSYDFGNQFFARASLGDVSGDFCGSTSLKVGGGYKVAWGEASHLYGVVSFQDSSYDGGGGDTGLVMGGGIRGYVSQGIEAYFQVDYSTLGDGDLTASGGGAYWFNKNFSVTGDIGFGSDQRSFAVGGRMAF